MKKKLWSECKRIIRQRHGNTCYTCGAFGLEGSNWQTGHSKPKGALPLRFKYDLRGLRPQCHRCNIHYGGVSDIFVSRLAQENEGLSFLKDSCYFDEECKCWRIRQDLPSMGSMESKIFINELLEAYKQM